MVMAARVTPWQGVEAWYHITLTKDDLPLLWESLKEDGSWLLYDASDGLMVIRGM
ncbi:MAG: hypothetical protein ABIJ56_08260 [Pseudomonadota bacterium]